MRLTTATEIKSAWDDNQAAFARRIDGLTAIQRQAVQFERPEIECAIKVVDVWPGSGTPYPHPLTGKPDATALITGLLQTGGKTGWSIFAPDPVRAVALINDEPHREWIVKRVRGDEVIVRGTLAWMEEFDYLIGGGHDCFGKRLVPDSRFA